MATRETERVRTRGRALRPIEPDHRLPAAGGATAGREGVGLADLIRSLADDTRALVRQEIGLARTEAKETAKGVVRDGAWIGAGAATAAVGALCLVLAAALGLGVLLGSYWLGTLLVGAALVAAGAIIAWKGIGELRGRDVKPTRTLERLREDAEWARDEAREFKDELMKERDQ